MTIIDNTSCTKSWKCMKNLYPDVILGVLQSLGQYMTKSGVVVVFRDICHVICVHCRISNMCYNIMPRYVSILFHIWVVQCSCLILCMHRLENWSIFWAIRCMLYTWQSSRILRLLLVHATIFIPLLIVFLHKSMSIWTSRWICPGWAFHLCKPHPRGNENRPQSDVAWLGFCLILILLKGGTIPGRWTSQTMMQRWGR